MVDLARIGKNNYVLRIHDRLDKTYAIEQAVDTLSGLDFIMDAQHNEASPMAEDYHGVFYLVVSPNNISGREDKPDNLCMRICPTDSNRRTRVKFSSVQADKLELFPHKVTLQSGPHTVTFQYASKMVPDELKGVNYVAREDILLKRKSNS